MKDLYKIYKRVADLFLDRECELKGVNSCIRFLMESGFSDEELEDLLFKRMEIKQIREELKEEEVVK